MFAWRFVQYRALCKQAQGTENKMIAFSVRRQEGLTYKRETRSTCDQSVKEVKMNWSALVSRRHTATKNPHAIIGNHQNVRITNPKVDASMGRHVCIEAHKQSQWRKHGKGTIAIKSEETEIHCVLKDGHTTTFSVRRLLKKIGRTPTKQQC